MHLTGLISKLLVWLSNLTLIEVDVPIPTDSLGVNSRSITSPSTKLCDVDTETTESILCSFPVTWSKLLSNLYSKLLDPTFESPKKASPSEEVVNPTWVTIPI